MDNKLEKNVLDFLYDDMLGDVPLNVTILNYGEKRERITVRGCAMKCYLNLMDLYDIDELLECKLQYLCYSARFGFVDVDFMKTVHKRD